MNAADSRAYSTGKNGEFIEIYLKFSGTRVEQANYLSDGNGYSCLCGSCTAELAIGRAPYELLKLTPTDVMRRVGCISADTEENSRVALAALHQAVHNYLFAQGKGIAIKRHLKRKSCFLLVGMHSSHLQYEN